MTELESGPEIYVEIGTGGLITVEVIGEGPAGPEGPPGEIGPQGDAFTYDDFTPEQLAALTGPQGADGSDGQDGAPGQDGADGVSPEVTITEITGGHAVTITDADHPAGQTFNVMDGTDGTDGQDGQDGADGADGQDGVSPEVTIADITGGHSVTITDADHPTGQTFNVMDGADGQDGQDGQNGADGQNGQDGDDGATFTPAVSAAGVISWTNDGGKQNPQSVDLVAAVLAALPTWQGGSY